MTPGFCEPPSKSPNIRWGGEDSGLRAGRPKYGHFLGLTSSIFGMSVCGIGPDGELLIRAIVSKAEGSF